MLQREKHWMGGWANLYKWLFIYFVLWGRCTILVICIIVCATRLYGNLRIKGGYYSRRDFSSHRLVKLMWLSQEQVYHSSSFGRDTYWRLCVKACCKVFIWIVFNLQHMCSILCLRKTRQRRWSNLLEVI